LLELDRCRQCTDRAGKLDQGAIAHELDKAATVARECWLQAFVAMLAKARKCSTFIAPHQARVADNVCSENRRQSALLTGHGNFLPSQAAHRRGLAAVRQSGPCTRKSAGVTDAWPRPPDTRWDLMRPFARNRSLMQRDFSRKALGARAE